MRVALAQINPTLGDFQLNAVKILDFILRAADKRANVVVFPEMCLFGYPAYDLLERPHLVKLQQQSLDALVKKIPKNITAIFGCVIENKNQSKKGGKPYFNAAVVVSGGKIVAQTAKQLLPSYDVFDDTRFFEPGEKTLILKIPHCGKVAITVCEDMWSKPQTHSMDPFKKIKAVDLIVNISASPFSLGKEEIRQRVAREHVKKIKAPFVYVNSAGAQDEIVFDGKSFALDKKGKLLVQASGFDEDLVIIDFKNKITEYRPSDEIDAEEIRKALVLGIRDFMRKTGQKKIHLGLSGGIDSAVAVCLAVDAVGPQNVEALLLPGPYSSEGSIKDSEKLAANLKIRTIQININKFYQLAIETFAELGTPVDAMAEDLSKQNLQSRIRALALMMFSNVKKSMLLSTSNKSELATGYSTLYGDSCGGLAPLGDLLKEQVYELAKHYNVNKEIIPNVIIKKAPSAELAPNQKDEDNLPKYEKLDAAVRNIVENKKAPSSDTEKWLEKKLFSSEFKRWQSPPILRISDHAFGRGRRLPIAYSIK